MVQCCLVQIRKQTTTAREFRTSISLKHTSLHPPTQENNLLKEALKLEVRRNEGNNYHPNEAINISDVLPMIQFHFDSDPHIV
jgi:hypothetical protein